jgi:hypothetical protein
MRKRDELQRGCMANALPDEMTFVLLARDEDAPETIRDWIKRRIARGKNKPDDPKIYEAEQCAAIMEAERADVRQRLEGIKPAPSSCPHRSYRPGPDIQLRYGSYKSIVCEACGMYCAVTHHGEHVGEWKPGPVPTDDPRDEL